VHGVSQWRAVMSVFGLNTSCESAQWKAVKYSSLMLPAVVSEAANIPLKKSTYCSVRSNTASNCIEESLGYNRGFNAA
jgi:hypothetical protein